MKKYLYAAALAVLLLISSMGLSVAILNNDRILRVEVTLYRVEQTLYRLEVMAKTIEYDKCVQNLQPTMGGVAYVICRLKAAE